MRIGIDCRIVQYFVLSFSLWRNLRKPDCSKCQFLTLAFKSRKSSVFFLGGGRKMRRNAQLVAQVICPCACIRHVQPQCHGGTLLCCQWSEWRSEEGEEWRKWQGKNIPSSCFNVSFHLYTKASFQMPLEDLFRINDIRVLLFGNMNKKPDHPLIT